MSWRQPAPTATSAVSSARRAATPAREPSTKLRGNFGHSYWMQTFEKPPRTVTIELRIAGFDAQEEAVGRGAIEGGDVEHRVIRHRQPIQRPHPEEAGQRRPEHRGLERHRDELRPAEIG